MKYIYLYNIMCYIGGTTFKLHKYLDIAFNLILTEQSVLKINKDLYELFNERKGLTTITYTHKRKHIHRVRFKDNEDLKKTILASCNIPYYSSKSYYVKHNNQKVVDSFLGVPGLRRKLSFYGCPIEYNSENDIQISPFEPYNDIYMSQYITPKTTLRNLKVVNERIVVETYKKILKDMESSFILNDRYRFFIDSVLEKNFKINLSRLSNHKFFSSKRNNKLFYYQSGLRKLDSSKHLKMLRHAIKPSRLCDIVDLVKCGITDSVTWAYHQKCMKLKEEEIKLLTKNNQTKNFTDKQNIQSKSSN